MAALRPLPSAHVFLRQATDRQHRRLDQASLLTSLLTPDVTVSVYRNALQALASAYYELDDGLAATARFCPAELPPYTPRLPLLRNDLAALGAESQLRQPREAKIPASPAAYLGMRYVVEGAQLGNRIIYRHLNATFGLELENFGSFWMRDSVPENTWPALLKVLLLLDSRQSLADASRAARQTFRHMSVYLACDNLLQFRA